MIRLLCVLLCSPSVAVGVVAEAAPSDEQAVADAIAPVSPADVGSGPDPTQPVTEVPAAKPVILPDTDAAPESPASPPPPPTSEPDVSEGSEETTQHGPRDDGPISADLSADVRLSVTFVDADLFRNQPVGAGLFHAAPLRLRIEEHEYEDLLYSRFLFAAARVRVADAALGVDVEVGLASRVHLDDSTATIRDDSSYIKLSRSTGVGNFILTAFPFNADRIRLGYSNAISWGTGRLVSRDAKIVPGAKIALDTDLGYAFLGAKAAPVQVLRNNLTINDTTAWGLLGGVGIRMLGNLHLELGAGRFMRGAIGKPDPRQPSGERLPSEPLTATGVSGQLSYAYGVVKQRPTDFQHLDNDPFVGDSGFSPLTFRNNVAVLGSAESTILRQPLQHPGARTLVAVQQAEAGDLSVRVAWGSVFARALYAYRSLSFILFDLPSSPLFSAFPEDAGILGEHLWGASLGYRVANIGLEPSASIEVRRPASYSTSVNAGNNPPPSLGQQILIFNSSMNPEILNPGEKAELVYHAKLSLKWLAGHTVAVLGELVVAHDRNIRRLDRDDGGISVRLKVKPTSVGLNIIVRVRLP